MCVGGGGGGCVICLLMYLFTSRNIASIVIIIELNMVCGVGDGRG